MVFCHGLLFPRLCVLFGNPFVRCQVFNPLTKQIMLQLSLIGHLGADAELKESNGKKFVSFRVAHTERFRDSQGNQKERTQWVSCALNGDGGELLKYLRRGTQVFVSGDMTLGIASSQIQRSMVATCNLHVRSVELLGGSGNDDVPRQLADDTGLLHQTLKLYTVSAESWKQLKVPKTGKVLYDTRGGQYNIDAQGFITRLKTPETQTENQQQDEIF